MELALNRIGRNEEHESEGLGVKKGNWAAAGVKGVLYTYHVV